MSKQVHYHVIENTPGYMPEDEDPMVTRRRRTAERHATSLKRQLLDNNWELAGFPDSPHYVASGSAREGLIVVADRNNEHDLGRVIEIMECTEQGPDHVCMEDRP